MLLSNCGDNGTTRQHDGSFEPHVRIPHSSVVQDSCRPIVRPLEIEQTKTRSPIGYSRDSIRILLPMTPMSRPWMAEMNGGAVGCAGSKIMARLLRSTPPSLSQTSYLMWPNGVWREGVRVTMLGDGDAYKRHDETL